MKKQKTILVVSPKGVPVKAFKLKFTVVFLVILFFVLGLIGYFIPYEKFTLNKVEMNQKKNLTEQNKVLLQNVVSTLKLLNNLKDQMNKLEAKRKTVLQFGIIGSDTVVIKRKKVDFSEMSSRDLLAYISAQETFIKKFTSHVNRKQNLFEHIPVVYPVVNRTSMSRQYGDALDPFTGKNKFHNGVDFVGEDGAPLIATASGVISSTENHPVWGRRIVIDHENGYTSVYAHVGELKIGTGQRINKGDVIGYIGLSGLTSGPHVHYELKYNGEYVNPAEYNFPVGLF